MTCNITLVGGRNWANTLIFTYLVQRHIKIVPHCGLLNLSGMDVAAYLFVVSYHILLTRDIKSNLCRKQTDKTNTTLAVS